MTTDADVDVAGHGSVFVFGLKTDAAREWVNENVALEDWQWFGQSRFAVDHRYAAPLAHAMREAGLVVV